ncbi:PAS domain S-box protein [Candidatus Uhrbacteria bacterium]|nr:PAS domain S-box protein [Candidatus Uhrbacteria bacterium]
MRRKNFSAHTYINMDVVYKNFLKKSKNAVFIVNTRDKIEYVSPSCKKIFGYSAAEFENSPQLAKKIVHPDSRKQFIKFWQTYGKTKVFPTKTSELKWNKKNGDVVVTKNNFVNLYEKNKNVGFLTVAEDITEKNNNIDLNEQLTSLLYSISKINQLIVKEKNEDKLLKQACKILHKTRKYDFCWIGKVDEANSQIIPIAKEGPKILINKFKIFTWTKKMEKYCHIVQAIKFHKIVFVNDLKPSFPKNNKFCAWHKKVINYGDTSTVFFPIVIKRKVLAIFSVSSDKDKIFNSKEIKLLRELFGGIALALQTIQTEKKEKELLLTLERESAITQNIIDLNPYAIALGKADGSMLRVNKSFIKLFGSSPPPDYNIFHDPLLAKAGYGKLFERLFKGEIIEFPKIWYNAHRMNPKLPDKEICIRSVLFPVKGLGEKIEYVVGMHENITQAAEVDKAKSEFVSLASHQLKTPLSGIKWFSELLVDKASGTLTKEQKQLAKEIIDANQRMIALVNALLNVSRIEMGTFKVEPKRTNLAKLVDKCLVLLDPKIKKHKIFLKKNYSITQKYIFTDPELIFIILQNLLTNAIQYTPCGGSVKIGLVSRLNDLLLTVSDTGIGIPLNAQDKIFSKLFRADNARTISPYGNGLGLYIVKSILDFTGGKIWFTSKVGKGTTFHVSLPLKGMSKKTGTKNLISG